ncbi:citrate synthase/methylcitrate synthase [Thermoflavimicrobium dichotomicum]|uniref:Citrate synthase n=1 Tax=Thermoflavimicrobium dichotomicum TaxID=46223 RepID=A0A1I3MN51_9BACL|nr:citrate synthase/methylcitrate synthase [Thermoflavimicrobium dichotomicum]SFI98458.1 citrate synthase [Thermoflavimicrobium dichotomicum]
MQVNPGLEGVVVAETAISHIDGQQGHLIYRGYDAKQLATTSTFEKVVHLLWKGHFPDGEEEKQWLVKCRQSQTLSDEMIRLIQTIPERIDMLSTLRSVLVTMENPDWPPTWEQAIRVLVQVPIIIAARYRYLHHKPIVPPRDDLSFAANYLYMLRGDEASEAHVKGLEAYLILTAEHGFNASTFTSRVVTSTESDILSAVVAAIGALKGRIHGGAPSEVDDMLGEIGSIERAESWMREKLERGEKLMGFGHRVYKTTDPRAEALRTVVQEYAANEPWFDFAVQVEQIALQLLKEYKPHRSIYTNVEFYTAAVLKAIQLPAELYTPTFVVSRTAGWIAHILEQASHNRIIRPDSRYVGPKCAKITK